MPNIELPNNQLGGCIIMLAVILIMLIPFVIITWIVSIIAPWWVAIPCGAGAATLAFMTRVKLKK